MKVDVSELVVTVCITLVVLAVVIGAYMLGSTVSQAAYEKEQAVVFNCLDSGMQWVEDSCVTKSE